MSSALKKVYARIDWPQFILTTFVSSLLGYWIYHILDTAEGKDK